MTVLHIPCPNCRKTLQLADRKYLGRRGKCAACGHSFVLREPPQEIELQPVADLAANPEEFFGSVADPPARAGRAQANAAAPAESGGFLRDLRRKRAQRRRQALIAGTVTAVVIAAAIAFFRPQHPSSPPVTRPTGDAGADGSHSTLASAIDANPLSASVLNANAELVAEVRPSHGEPIDLRMLPSGVNLVIHLRPAELWSEQPRFQELRGALTQNVTDWIAQQLQTTCRRAPRQIEEALIGVLLGPTGSTPAVAVVVRLTEPARLSDLIEEFRGEPVRPEGSLRLFRGTSQAYLIRDERTIAICPANLADDLAEWVETPNYNTTDGILQLLSQTDRQRLFTVIFEVQDVRRHEDWLFSQAARPAFLHLLDLLGEETETACWSIHLGDELHSELHVRTRVAGAEGILGPVRLAETLSARIVAAPERLLADVRSLDPRHAGTRQLIGRLPAMIEATRRATVVTTGERRVQFTTLLPAKAAPNLALATLLAWNESLNASDEPDQSTVASAGAAQLPESFAERLKLPVDAEFRRTPLREAFAYVCNEIRIRLEIDGDALKDAGYTQNMPQTFNIGKVPADVALSRIVSQYDGDGKEELRMVIVGDAASRTLRVMTRKFADREGLTPLDLPPPPE